MSCDLSAIGVLVTRASHQAEPLCQLIEACGGTPIKLPAVEIQATPPRDFKQVIDHSDIVIFISPNAVRFGLQALTTHTIPNGVKVAAVGRATARRLSESGIKADIVPQQAADSEALLDQPELQQVTDSRIVIVRGNGGRELLADTLKQRGARVIYAEVYKRNYPQSDIPPTLIGQWKDQIQIVTVTSIDLLNNLITMLGECGRPLLFQTPLLVISRRMRERALALGFQSVILSEGAHDQAIIDALCQWKAELTE